MTKRFLLSKMQKAFVCYHDQIRNPNSQEDQQRQSADVTKTNTCTSNDIVYKQW